MAVIVEIPSALRRFAADASQVEVGASATLGAALTELVARHPKLRRQLFADGDRLFGFVGVFINNQDVGHGDRVAAPIKPGDVVSLVPAVAGG